MGLDPSILHREHIAKMLDHAERKKAGVQTAAEANAKCEARSEKLLQDQICAYLTLRGVKRIVRSRFDKPTRQAAGNPDLLFAYRGTPVCFEVKLTGGVVSAAQQEALTDLWSDGWHGGVVRSVEQVRQFLDNLLK